MSCATTPRRGSNGLAAASQLIYEAPAENCFTLLPMSFWDTLGELFAERSVVLGFVIAAAIVLAGTPLTIRLANRIGGVDSADDRPRVHTGPIPRIGGLAIVVGPLLPPP